MRRTPFSLILTVVFLVTVAGPVALLPGSFAQLGVNLALLPTTTILHPRDASRIHYRVWAEWEADDPDGTLDFFEYAVDSLDWTATPRTMELISFTTPDPESVLAGGSVVPGDMFTGVHTLYVRAVDDTGGVSDPDSVTFTAYNTKPSSVILRPNIGFDPLTLGESLELTLDGEDPDGSEANTKPVGYLYKLARVDTLTPPIPIVHPNLTPEILYTSPGDWTFHEFSNLKLELDVPGQYVIGVRAVDEAGAIESDLQWGRNTLKAITVLGGGKPVITLSESVLGTIVFDRTKTVHVGELPHHSLFVASITCDAEAYGGVCLDWRTATDPADINNPDWTEWQSFGGGEPPRVTLPTYTTREPSPVVMVQTRDDMNGVTTATLEYDVVPMLFDRKVLWVDDSLDSRNPRDAEHDDFWRARFSAYEDLDSTDVFELHTFGPGDVGSTNPIVPTLAELGRYELVVWECQGAGFNGNSGLLQVTGLQNRLGGYLRAGGRLWLGGRLTVAATTPNASMTGGDLVYPKEELGPGDFAWDFLKLHSTRIDNDKGNQTRNLFNTAIPFSGQSHPFSSMTIDLDKLNLAQQSFGGFSHADAVFDPIFAEQEPGFQGRVDSLYVYGAAGNLVQGQNSSYHNRLCAVRYDPPESLTPSGAVDPGWGRVLWFGFSLYYFDDAEAQDTFDKALDWFFGKEVPPTPVRLTHFEVERAGESALIRWGVGAREDHAGFHVYRADPLGNERTQLTRTLLSGRERYEFEDSQAPKEGADYWLAEISRSGETAWHGPRTLGPADVTPRRVTLSPAWPNPFSDRTRIAYTVVEESPVTLTVFDVQGRQVAVLVNETQPAGRYEIPWNARRDDGSTAAAGMYIIRLTAGGEARIQKTILTR